MADLDLDALERARMETLGKKRHAVVFHGTRFPLPPELPLKFAIDLAQGDLDGALRCVLNGKADDFLALEPSTDDFRALAENITELYAGRGVGESSASGSSSRSTSSRSRRTSNGSTA